MVPTAAASQKAEFGREGDRREFIFLHLPAPFGSVHGAAAEISSQRLEPVSPVVMYISDIILSCSLIEFEASLYSRVHYIYNTLYVCECVGARGSLFSCDFPGHSAPIILLPTSRSI